ncbi:phage tail protein I [Paenibacillus sp. GCM10012307]|uniref:Phage tail protein I n=1 Tax=Paenibacillus roseus TaxID=2798579 RepID=A0A934J5R9_9BACL|nr:phage tail protein I [Paenibacillus roseus]MBJ6362088.1 phage tail protein I [Paenibacillus roseus]
MIEIRQINLLDLIPANLQHDEQVRAAAEAINQELLRVTQLASQTAILHHVDSLDERWVDELAYQFHVDFYDPDLPLSQRRQLVQNSLAWHKRKGTPSAVKELIATVFGSGDVQEWYEYGGEPYHFKVVTSDPSATGERAKEFVAAIQSVKNTRSWLDSIEITTEGIMQMYFGNVLQMGEFMTVEQVV